MGNTVIVVEHDTDAILTADHVVDMGPGAGVHGGEIVAEGTPDEIKANPASLTGQYLSGKRCIEVPKNRQKPDPQRMLRLTGATGNNLKNVPPWICRWGCSCVSPACPARANPPWSTIRCTAPCHAISTDRQRSRLLTRICMAWSSSTR